MKDTIKVLLVDDEYLALNLLENFLAKIPNMKVVAKTTSPIEALEILNKGEIDVLFLDIQMPLLSGVNLLKTLNKPPITILTTAYSEYAVEAFELQVADYLLKPFSFERLLKAVQKVKEMMEKKSPQTIIEEADKKETSFTVKTDGRLIKLNYDEILFIESYGEYVYYITANQKIISLQSLKKLEEELPTSIFMRVHKSYIINKQKVFAVEGGFLEIEKHKIPVSREKRSAIVRAIFGEE
jgi:two-component system, LytTR family, response regulator LytT